jgi:hypothetical protein
VGVLPELLLRPRGENALYRRQLDADGLGKQVRPRDDDAQLLRRPATVANEDGAVDGVSVAATHALRTRRTPLQSPLSAQM